MGKRVDNDATQDVSASMLVDGPKPPVYPKVPTNDASMWMQAPVSVDDFVSGPRKKPTAPRGGRGLIVAVMVLLFLGTAGTGVWYAFLRDRPKETSPYAAAGSGSASAGQKPAVATEAADAAVAVAAVDAGVAEADAAVSPGVAALNADAISGADPAAKKVTKKRPATKKKATAKKKTATAPKKKRR